MPTSNVFVPEVETSLLDTTHPRSASSNKELASFEQTRLASLSKLTLCVMFSLVPSSPFLVRLAVAFFDITALWARHTGGHIAYFLLVF